MATLAELRASRYEGIEEDRVGTDQRAAREWSSGRVTIPDEYQVHYRDDYGTTLTDKQYADANADQAEFKSSVATAKSSLAGKKVEVDNLYNKQIEEWKGLESETFKPYKSYVDAASKEYADSQVDVETPTFNPKKTIELNASKAYTTDIQKNTNYMDFYNSWATNNATKVYVKDPKNPSINKEYWVTPDTARAIDKIDFQGYGDTVRQKDGSVLVFSDTYAGDLRDELDKYEAKLHSALSTSYKEGLTSNIATGRETLDREAGLARESIASQERIIAAKEDENINTLNTIRAVYANKLNKMSETIGSMGYAKSN